jgi:hypothetical protein|tara:strand:- start:46 stop:369 length:324 start_codon:yes stop_codon:yes gene_type:complete
METNEPYIGMPATIGSGSDSYPATVIEISHRSSDMKVNKIAVQWDKSKVVGGEWPDLDYEYERNPDGRISYYSLRKNGRFKLLGWALRSPGGTIGLGHRRYYQDPSF